MDKIDQRKCLYCKNKLIRPKDLSNKAWGGRKFCNRKCTDNYVKEFGALNIGSTKGRPPNGGSFKKGEHRSASTEFDGSYSGSKHWNWKGGKTKESDTIRTSAEYKKWRKAVFERDDYTCVWCKARSGNGKKVTLHADHIKPFAYFPELRLDVSNGRTLCKSCHRYTATYLSRVKGFYHQNKEFVLGKDRIEYGGVQIGPEEHDAIFQSIFSQGSRRWTIGPESIAFEKELAEATGVKYAVLVNSGSSALLAGTLALNLPKESKVIIPALTFPTAYSSILQAGLIPVVIDCDKETLNINYEALEKAIEEHPDAKAVVAIHIAGNVVDLERVREIVGDRYIIGDGCDSYGATIKGKFVETYTDVAAISMHAAHIISMGEGGAVLTDNKDIADRARKIREWGRESGSDKLTTLEGFPEDYRERYVFTEIGYNLKPLELQCAMGRVQLRRLQEFKKNRKRVHDRLTKIFMGRDKFDMVKLDCKDSEPCWFSFAFHCVGRKRKEVMEELEKMNIETRTVFSGNILRHPAYKKAPHIKCGDLDNCDYVMANSMFIGSPPFYTDEQLNYIEKVVNSL